MGDGLSRRRGQGKANFDFLRMAADRWMVAWVRLAFAKYNPAFTPEAAMAFFLGLILFVVVVGALDARFPWPRPRRED